MRKRLGPNDEDGKLTSEEEELNQLLGLDQQLIKLNEAQQSDDRLYKELLLENNNADLPEDETLRRHDEIALIQERMRKRAKQIEELRGKKQRKKHLIRNKRNKDSTKQQKPSEKEYDL